jgi:tetratricopeptide (TPR) repeat protein
MSSIATSEIRWWRCLSSEDLHTRAQASFALAALLWQRGEVVGAEQFLRDTTESPDRGLAAAGRARLAHMLDRRGDSASADAMYESTAEVASAEQSPEVLLDLAARWLARGRAADAANAYWAIQIETAEPHLRALAAYRLGDLQSDAGLVEEAIASWRQALGEVDEELRPHVMVALAEALMEPEIEEDEAAQAVASESLVRPESNQEAEQMLELVLSSDHPDLAPRAALGLGRLKREEGELREAYRFFQLVIESEHPEYLLDAHAEQSELIHRELDLIIGPLYESPAPRGIVLARQAKKACRWHPTVHSFIYGSILEDLIPVVPSPSPMVLNRYVVKVARSQFLAGPAFRDMEPKFSNHDPQCPTGSVPAYPEAASSASSWMVSMLTELKKREPETRRGESRASTVPSVNLRRFVASTLTPASSSPCPTFENYFDSQTCRAVEEFHAAPFEPSVCPLVEVAAGHQVEVEVDPHGGELVLVLQGPSGVRRLARGAAVDRMLWHRILDLLIFDTAGLLTELRQQVSHSAASEGADCRCGGEGECALAQAGSYVTLAAEPCAVHSGPNRENRLERGTLLMEPLRLWERFGLGDLEDRDD